MNSLINMPAPLSIKARHGRTLTSALEFAALWGPRGSSKHVRGIAIRYDGCPEIHLAAVKLGCARTGGAA